jgi:putative membrane protein
MCPGGAAASNVLTAVADNPTLRVSSDERSYTTGTVMRFLIRLLSTAAALWAAVHFVEGITYSGPWLGLLAVAVIFGLVNAIIRPILAALTCPLVMLTLGLFVFVLNGIMLLITSAISKALGFNFHVDGFVAAIIGALIVGITSAVLNLVLGDGEREKKAD